MLLLVAPPMCWVQAARPACCAMSLKMTGPEETKPPAVMARCCASRIALCAPPVEEPPRAGPCAPSVGGSAPCSSGEGLGVCAYADVRLRLAMMARAAKCRFIAPEWLAPAHPQRTRRGRTTAIAKKTFLKWSGSLRALSNFTRFTAFVTLTVFQSVKLTFRRRLLRP